MTRNIVKGAMVLASPLWLMGTSCSQLVDPAGIVPAGDYRLVRSTPDKTWEVSAPRTAQPGCGALVDARLVIGEDGSVVHTRTIRHLEDGALVTTDEELRGRVRKYSKDADTQLDFRAWMDVIRWQVEPTTGDPEFTVLFVDHWFPGTPACAGRRLVLRYTIGGVDH